MSSIRLSGLLAVTLVAILSRATSLSAAEWKVEKSDAGAKVTVDGDLVAEYRVLSGMKPVLWPVRGPGGVLLTRSYPVASEEVVSEQHDHIHHRGLWLTHGNVNGFDFWEEAGDEHQGKIVHRDFVKLEADKEGATIVTRNDWQGAGATICEDERTLRFGANNDARWIDFDVTLKATKEPVEFGDTKEGSFGIRVPTSISIEGKQGGTIINSEGLVDGQTWGKRAAWVDYHGPIEGQTYGIAIFNHPSSFRFPTWWHVRPYGLFAANPFGEKAMSGDKTRDGRYTIEKGKELQLRYRVLLHRGDEKQAHVAEAYEAYSKEERAKSP